MNQIEIVIYATDAEKEPFSEWEEGLDKKIRALVQYWLEYKELL